MNPDEIEAMAAGEQTTDAVYRWTIRSLYALAIAANVWVLWSQADSTTTAALTTRLSTYKARLLAPLRSEQLFRRSVNHVLFQAEQIVEGVDNAQ